MGHPPPLLLLHGSLHSIYKLSALPLHHSLVAVVDDAIIGGKLIIHDGVGSSVVGGAVLRGTCATDDSVGGTAVRPVSRG
jgi:hypothetical protein